jgi:hypothetical protein
MEVTERFDLAPYVDHAVISGVRDTSVVRLPGLVYLPALPPRFAWYRLAFCQ